MERPYEQQHDRDARPVSEITKLDVLEVILAGHRADEITPFAQTRFAMEMLQAVASLAREIPDPTAEDDHIRGRIISARQERLVSQWPQRHRPRRRR